MSGNRWTERAVPVEAMTVPNLRRHLGDNPHLKAEMLGLLERVPDLQPREREVLEQRLGLRGTPVTF